MPVIDAWPLFVGAVVIGLIHGAEPGHGWPIAATYALDRQQKWLNGFLASVLLGIGHLVSSIAVVVVYFLAISYFDLTQVNDPLSVFGFQIGGPVGIVAGVLLILLGVREYRYGHSHSHGNGHSHDDHDEHSHDHEHDGGRADHDHAQNPLESVHAIGHDHGHDHDHDHGNGHDHDHGDHTHDHTHDHAAGGGWWDRAKARLPFVGGHSHSHDHDWSTDTRGLVGLTWTAFVLGFAHEEEFEIIGLCTGSPDYCLSLMLVYAFAVIFALVGLTLGLVAGYERHEERVERYAEHFPTLSAVVLSVMGLGFIVGLF